MVDISRLFDETMSRRRRSTGSSAALEAISTSEISTKSIHIPLGRSRPGLVSALQKLKQSRLRRVCLASFIVHQKSCRTSALCSPERLFGAQRLLGQAFRFRSSVGVEGWCANVFISHPEPEAYDLMRVGFARNLISTLPFWCSTT